MKTKLDLVADRDHKIRSADDIVQNAREAVRTITAEERKQIADYAAEIKGIDLRIAEITASDLAIEQVDALVASRRAPESRVTAAITPTGGEATPSKMRVEVRPIHAPLKNFTGPNAVENAHESGMWIRAAVYGDERAKRWCANRGLETRAMSEGNNLYGGALVPDAFSQTIINLQEQYGVARQEAQIYPMGSDHIDVPIHKTGITASWTAEAAATSESTPEWATLGLTAKKLTCLVKLSTEVAEDAVIDIADFLAGQMARAFAKAEDDACFKGAGLAAHGGVFGWTCAARLNNTALAGSIVTPSGADAYAEYTVADVETLMGLCPEYARPNAKFYCSQVASDLVFQALAAAAGGTTMAMMGDKFRRQWLGYPIVTTPSMPTSTADISATVMLIFGDMRLATAFGDRRTFGIKVLNELYAANDQIGIMATERIDIANHGYGTTTAGEAGPMVGIVGT